MMDETRFETLVREALDERRDLRTTLVNHAAADDPRLRAAVNSVIEQVDILDDNSGDQTQFASLVREALGMPQALRETFVADATAANPALRDAASSLLATIAQGPSNTETPQRQDPQVEALVREALELPESDRKTFISERTSDNTPLRQAVTKAVSESMARVADKFADVELELGQKIGPYELRERLGEGGMGAVYLAHQSDPVERFVALKCIKPGVDSRELLMRFESERRALAMMSHPNVAAVFDAGVTAQGRPYFAMEYVPGVEITDYCDRNRLSIRERIKLFIQACEGVEHAHQKAIIHRDLKPSNILVTEKSERPLVKIIDFGIAKSLHGGDDGGTMLTQVGGFIGTPLYASPEQTEYSSADLDTRTDVYSLGVILYELLVGCLPFDPRVLKGQKLRDMQEFLREVEPPTPQARFSKLVRGQEGIAQARALTAPAIKKQLGGDIGWITMRALEKARDDRYASVDALIADLRRYLRDAPVDARAPTVGYRVRKFVCRHRTAVTSVALIIIVAVGVAVSSTVLFLEARQQSELADANAARAERAVAVFFDMLRAIEPSDLVDGRLDADALIRDGARRVQANFSDSPARQALLMIELAESWAEINPWLASELLDVADSAIAGTDVDPARHRLQSRHLIVSAVIANMIGTAEESMHLAEESVAEARSSQDPASLILALETLSVMQQDLDQYEAALQTLEEKQELLEAGGLDMSQEDIDWQFGHTLLGMSDSWMQLGEDGLGKQALAEARRYFEAANDAYGLVDVATREATVLVDDGAFVEAIEVLEGVAATERAAGSVTDLAHTLHLMGGIALEYGDLERAHAALAEALETFRGQDAEGQVAGLLGLVHLARKDSDPAMSLLSRSRAIALAMESEGSYWTAISHVRLTAAAVLLEQATDLEADLASTRRAVNAAYGEDTWLSLLADALPLIGDVRAGDRGAVENLERTIMELRDREANEYWVRTLARLLVESSTSPQPEWIELTRSRYERESSG